MARRLIVGRLAGDDDKASATPIFAQATSCGRGRTSRRVDWIRERSVGVGKPVGSGQIVGSALESHDSGDAIGDFVCAAVYLLGSVVYADALGIGEDLQIP
jgi:hypothetical protein